jgi:hypothetical protein
MTTMPDQPCFALAPLYGPYTLETHRMLERWTEYRDTPAHAASERQPTEYPGVAVARAVIAAALHKTNR